MAERKNSEKRIASNNKWTNAHYDRVNLAIPKGRKDIIKAHADVHGESINAFLGRAIQEAIERDAEAAPEAPQETGAGILTPSTLKAAQEAAEAAGEAVPQFVARAVETQAQRDAMSRRMKGGKPNE